MGRIKEQSVNKTRTLLNLSKVLIYLHEKHKPKRHAYFLGNKTVKFYFGEIKQDFFHMYR